MGIVSVVVNGNYISNASEIRVVAVAGDEHIFHKRQQTGITLNWALK